MKNNGFYVECAIDVNKVIIDNGNEVIVHDTKGLLFWYDRYQLLSNQSDKSKVSKTKIGDKWYKFIESTKCIDLRQSNQLLLTQ